MTAARDPRTVAWARVGIVWRATGDAQWPYRAEVNGHALAPRVNDFPAEPLSSLFAGEVPVTDLEDWPQGWVRAAGSPAP